MIAQVINRRHIRHPTEFEEELYLFRSESIDIHTVLAHEPFEGLHLTSRASRIATEEGYLFSFFMCR